MSEMTVVTDAELVEQAVQSLTTEDAAIRPAYGPFGRRYHPAVLGTKWTDTSFAVFSQGQPVAAIICGSCEGRLTYFDMPLPILISESLGARSFRLVLKTTLERFRMVGRKHGSTVCVIDDSPLGTNTSRLGRFLHSVGAVPRLDLRAVVHLEAPPEEIVANVRKSHKYRINWGRRNITLSYVNADNPDPAMFNRYQKFHKRIAGRVTRPQASWDIMYETIASGSGELSLGHDDTGTLVSGTLVIDNDKTSQYSSAVFERSKFDKPMGHWPVFDAILRAKSRGKTHFDLGDVPSNGTASDKELSIGMFKRGFVDSLDFRLVWELPLDREW
ncbi:MAG: hypothetical protein OXC91_04175 [Rhodobacteraceae bacterium]|nr:hypothetical protein [Paracoccaceae bacterium]